MANRKQVKVQMVCKGGSCTVPANTPLDVEVVCQAAASGSFDPGPDDPVDVLGVREMSSMEPTDIEIPRGGTLVVDATASEYELVRQLGRFAQSPYLSNRDVDIVVRIFEDE